MMCWLPLQTSTECLQVCDVLRAVRRVLHQVGGPGCPKQYACTALAPASIQLRLPLCMPHAACCGTHAHAHSDAGSGAWLLVASSSSNPSSKRSCCCSSSNSRTKVLSLHSTTHPAHTAAGQLLAPNPTVRRP